MAWHRLRAAIVPRMTGKLGLALAGLLLSLTAGEAALRVAYPRGIAVPLGDEQWPWLERDPVLGWRNRANYGEADVSINDLHFRGPAIRRQKPDGTLRLVCLGDSRTFGVWLDLGRFRYDNDYPRLLDRRIRGRRDLRPVEVINAAVVGHTTAHGLRLLTTSLRSLAPDILVVGYGMNEFAPFWNAALRARDPRSSLLRALLVAGRSLRLVQLGLHAHQSLPSRHPRPFTEPWLSEPEYGQHLRRLAEEARDRGIRLLLLDMPLRPIDQGESLPAFPGTQPAYELRGAVDLAGLHRLFESYRRRARSVARSESLPIADAGAAFRDHRGAAPFGPYDLVHCNDEGARVTAEIVFQRLVELDWLTP